MVTARAPQRYFYISMIARVSQGSQADRGESDLNMRHIMTMHSHDSDVIHVTDVRLWKFKVQIFVATPSCDSELLNDLL